jgi:hypothetical protein
MSQQMDRTLSRTPLADQGFQERWAAWQARGIAHDRATRRKVFIMAALIVVSAAILNGLLSFR